jgi:hypothetical protein
MWIFVVLIGILLFWLGNQNQKAKPAYQRENTFAFNYLFPFSKPYEAEKISTLFTVDRNSISMKYLSQNKIITYQIKKIVNDSFSKNYHCENNYGDLVLIYFFRDGARLQDFGTGHDIKFTKEYPNSNHYSS